MKIRMKRGWLIAAILLAVLLGNSWVFSYHPHEFQGGLSIHDSGFFSLLRRIGPISIVAARRLSVHCSGPAFSSSRSFSRRCRRDL